MKVRFGLYAVRMIYYAVLAMLDMVRRLACLSYGTFLIGRNFMGDVGDVKAQARV